MKYNIKKLLINTPIEIYICAFIGILLAFYISFSHENIRTKSIPVGYSEISIIKKEAQNSNESIGELTNYITSTNDSVMDIFDAWNRTQISSGNFHRFALELDYKIDPSLKIDIYTLSDRLNIVQEKTPIIQEGLIQFDEFNNDIAKLINLLEKTWSEQHIDNYRDEIYLDSESYIDSNGHIQTRSVPKIRQVYYNTTHIYIYNKNNGEKSSEFSNYIINKYGEIKLPEKIRIATTISPDNEYAAERSRNFINLKQEEIIDISHTWRNSSVIINNINSTVNTLPVFKDNLNNWDNNKNKAHSISYETFSQIDNGPKEFQIINKMLVNSRDIHKYLNTIIETIYNNQKYSRILQEKINEFISIEMNSLSGNPKKLQKEIMKVSIDFYNTNFSNGFDVNRFRWLIVIVSSIIGLIIGSIIGVIWEFLGRKIYPRNKWEIT